MGTHTLSYRYTYPVYLFLPYVFVFITPKHMHTTTKTREEKIRNAFIMEAVWEEKFEEIIKHPDFLKLSNP